MIDEALSFIKKEGRGFDWTHDFHSGKELRLYYSKKDFISINVEQYTEEEEIKLVMQNKTELVGLCRLCKVLKTNASASEFLRKNFDERLLVDTNFSISLYKEKIKITYFEKEILFPVHGIEKLNFESISIFIRAANNKKFSSYLLKFLPDYLIKENENEIKKIYFRKIKGMNVIRKAIEEFEDLSSNLANIGLTFTYDKDTAFWVSRDILDYHMYSANIGIDGIYLYLGGKKMFLIKKEAEFVFSASLFENIYKECCLLNRMYYDFYIALDSAGCDMSNLNIFFLNRKGYISNYRGFIKVRNFNEAYQFVLDTCKKYEVKESLKEKFLLARKNHVNVLWQCMKAEGFVSMEQYRFHAKRLGISDTNAIKIYCSLHEILPCLVQEHMVKSYKIVGDKYHIEFCCDEILPYFDADSIIKTKDKMEFKDAIMCMPPECIKELYNDPECIKENSLLIINGLFSSKEKNGIKEVFIFFLPFVDKKYLPLIRLKLNRVDAKSSLGDLYYKVEKFLEDGGNG